MDHTPPEIWADGGRGGGGGGGGRGERGEGRKRGGGRGDVKKGRRKERVTNVNVFAFFFVLFDLAYVLLPSFLLISHY